MRSYGPLPVLVLLWCTTGASGCSESDGDVGSAEEPERPRPVCDAEGNVVQKAPSIPPSCSFQQSNRPGDERFHRCTFRGGQPVCWATWSGNDPTPAGPYQCTCNSARLSSGSDPGREVVVDIEQASDCEAALDAACQVDRQATPPCAQPTLGQCWPVLDQPGRWTCQCDGSEALHDIRHEACGTAIFLACGAPCSDGYSSCQPDRENIGYRCECPGGEQVFWPGMKHCGTGLYKCRPSPRCEAAVGACASRPGGFGCRCASAAPGEPGSSLGNPIVVSEADASDCLPARDIACGVDPGN